VIIAQAGTEESLAVTVVAVLILVGVLAGGVVAMVFGAKALRQRLSASPEVVAHRSEIRSARREVRRSTRAHDRALKSAERELSASQRDHQRRLDEAEQELNALTDARGRLVARFAGVSLYTRTIETPGGSGPLQGVTAVCDSAGQLVASQRATLTRMAAGGLALGGLGAILSLGFQKRRIDDQRELYLMIAGPGVAHVAKLSPNDGHQARQFAAQVNAHAMAAASVEAQLPGLIDQARQRLEHLRSDTAEIEARRRGLDLVANHGDLVAERERARTHLEMLERAGPQIVAPLEAEPLTDLPPPPTGISGGGDGADSQRGPS